MLEIRLIVRAAHLLAGAAWVGGSFFYLMVALPALRNGGSAPGAAGMGNVAGQMAALFKRMVTICTGVLLLSGAYLAFDRLTTTTLGWPYLSVLALKIVIALCMFALAIYLGQSNVRRLAKRATRLSKVAPQLTLVLGILVFVLGALLNILFETSAHP
ncbi:MAG TPA: CopD family protein [Ktedonobacteraceae bacterium]|nr:CopD family protein [Ktedonobacteraceae bacterium]